MSGFRFGSVLRRGRVNLLGAGVVLGTIAVWQGVVVGGLIVFDYVPAPTEVVGALADLVRTRRLIDDLIHTVGMSTIAATIGMVVGVSTGLALGLFRRARTYSMASVDFLRTIPVTALVPVCLLLWGPTATVEVAVASFAATWPFLINTAGGVRTVSPELHNVARSIRLSRTETVRKIILPASAPSVLVGARLALVVALSMTIVAEMVAHPEGLGWGLIEFTNALRPDRLWAYTVVAGLVGYLLNAALFRISRWLLPGSAEKFSAGAAP